MAKAIEMFETEDGKVFYSLEEAEAHETKKELESNLSKFVDEHMFSGVSKDNIFDILLRERADLLNILTGKF